MTIIALDDEKLALKGIISKLKKLCSMHAIVGFSDAHEAVSFAEKNKVDIAFLDIEMKDLNGVEVAKKLKETNASINIIFSTGYREYMEEAFLLIHLLPYNMQLSVDRQWARRHCLSLFR